jgi:hypothetical protein
MSYYKHILIKTTASFRSNVCGFRRDGAQKSALGGI